MDKIAHSSRPLKQAIPSGLPLEVFRLKGFSAADAFDPHRHGFCMWLWVTRGHGLHRIDHREYEMLPGRVFFMQDGQLHQVIAYPEDGWVVLFSPALFREYLRSRPIGLACTLFDRHTQRPFIEPDGLRAAFFKALLPLLSPGSPCLALNLFALLGNTAALAAAGPLNETDRDLMTRLRALIDLHFTREREATFYGAQLGLSARRLNRLCREATGVAVHELAVGRLLAECELLLGSGQQVKWIVGELGFLDHAHFSVFFRRHRGMTPTDFCRRLRYGNRPVSS